jgi:hypothetical protein
MIFKLVFFTIFLNLGVGILNVAIPELDRHDVTDQSADVIEWQTNLVNSSAGMTDVAQNTGLFSFLGLGDFAVLKLVTQFLTGLDRIALGFVHMLDVWFGGYLQADNPALHTALFGALRTISALAYAFGLFYLFTGKRVDDYG